jgi:hypothetical protein
MKPVTRVRPKVGDICKIATDRGVAYFQYTHKHERYGALIRVFPGIFATEPDLDALIEEEAIYTTFFPLGVACSRGIANIVAGSDVKPQWAKFPVFRTAVVLPDGRSGPWWLWDGEREWKIGTLRPEHENFPLRGVCNDTFLIEKIIEANKS